MSRMKSVCGEVRRTRSVRMEIVAFVFIIMMCSTMLSSLFMVLSFRLRLLNFEKDLFRIPIIPIVFLMVSVLIGTALSYGVSKKLLAPIKELVDATQQIAKGNFSVRVKVGNHEREVERLVHSFNHMAYELESVEMFKSDFINYFSHEFKTPITSIRGFAKQLRQSNLSADLREEYADIIYKESERLVKLSSNVLLLTKLENQSIVTDRKSFSIDEQLRHCMLLLQEEWEEKGLNLHLNLEEIHYLGNEEMLSQVWINLISNAINHSDVKGDLWISCSMGLSRVKIKIKDSGMGMDDETLSRIFDKFYQGDLSHKAEGSGLGLSIVRRIVDLCEGKIVVKSQKGRGSTFIIYLPLEK